MSTWLLKCTCCKLLTKGQRWFQIFVNNFGQVIILGKPRKYVSILTEESMLKVDGKEIVTLVMLHSSTIFF